MNQESFNKIVEDRIALVRSTLTSKGEEYTSNEDVFEAFNTMASGLSFHSDSKQVLWELLVKHLYSIRKMITTNNMPSKELVKEKIGDAVNYLILLEGIFNEDIDNTESIIASLERAGHKYCVTKETLLNKPLSSTAPDSALKYNLESGY